MHIAVHISNDKTAAHFLQLLEEYQQKRDCTLSYVFFNNQVDLTVGFNGGEYDAIFWGGYLTEQIINEIRGKDKRVKLVSIVEAGSATPDNGYVWYCLSESLGEAFLFPVLDRLIEDISQENDTGLLIKSKGYVMNLSFSSISCVEVLHKSVFFHLSDGKTEEVRSTLSNFETRLLCCPDFIKVHRAYIVNLNYMEKLSSTSILLRDGRSVPVSKHLYPHIKKNWLCSLMNPSMTWDVSTTAVKSAYSILLVDDEEEYCCRFGKFLIDKGCVVRTASTGEDAMLKATQEHFDCVLLDVLLGEKKGFDYCKDLQKATGAPVIYLSCLTDSENQVQGFLSGGIDYITKDTTEELLWLKLEARINLASTGQDELNLGDFHLDLKNRRVFLRDQEVLLTTIEFDLLCLLMRSPGEVYSPLKLYEMVWGKRPLNDEQTIQLHMIGLWRKFERICPGQTFIRTVWGEGYRFSPLGEGDDEDESY